MYKIKFLKDYKVNAVDGEDYKAGQVVDVGNEASYNHFIRRGVAVDAGSTKQPEPEQSEDLKEGTMPWLKEQLDKAGIEYKSNASKGDLEELYMTIGE